MAGRAGRTYKRDGNGRFASTGTSGKKSRPPAKTVAKGVNKLTRDNAGKITSVGGDGATARGGRLKTAAGNLRATQTKRLKTMQGVSYGKPAAKGSKAASSKLRPGEFVKANLRPRNVAAKPVKGENPFADANQAPFADRRKAALQNVKTAQSWLESKGITAKVYSGKKGTYARADTTKGVVQINRNSDGWADPAGAKRYERRIGFKSTSSPVHTLWHEMGHLKDKRLSFRWQEAVNSSMTNAGRKRRYNSFETAANPSLPKVERKRRGKEIGTLARRVSSYATTNPSEFIAETYAGRRTGRKYDYQVMSAYREAKGLNPNPIVRKLKKKPKK